MLVDGHAQIVVASRDKLLLFSSTMKLDDYLKRHKKTQAEFAEQVGVTAEAVRLWITGGRSPSSTTMRSIIDATDGKVQPNDFFQAA